MLSDPPDRPDRRELRWLLAAIRRGAFDECEPAWRDGIIRYVWAVLDGNAGDRCKLTAARILMECDQRNGG
jgi:hypothetical protein